MKYTKLSIILLVSILILGVTSMNVFGFLFGSTRTEKWKEEVQLSDGRVIVVEREILRERGGDEWAFNRSGTKPKEYRIQFAYPSESGKTIEWRSSKKSPRRWPEIPLILDMESGLPTVFAIVAISNAYEVYSKYVYRNGGWIEEPLPDTFEKLTTNLFLRLGVDMPKYVDLETKRKVNVIGEGFSLNLREVGPNRKVSIHRIR